MQTPFTSIPCENCHTSRLAPGQDCWTDFNQTLNRGALGLPNEVAMAGRLAALLEMDIGDLRVFWLTLARMVELVRKQAGDYADNCEFQAAGDLLVNPRRIDVYRRGRATPVVKDRHRGLSQQFAAASGSGNPVAWLSRETIPHIREDALLPYLREMLASCSYISPEYLADLDRRMSRVADTIAFLMSWAVSDSVQLYRRMHDAGPEDEAFIQSNLCRFDLDRFNAMAADIDDIVMNGGGLTRFLSDPRVQ